MATHILWCAFAWTFKGLLCTCRFFWVSPYYSIKYMPNEPHRTGKDQVKQKTGSANQEIPGSHDSSAMQRRLSKAEREIQALKTQITFERATWERKFVELQVIQQDLRYQLISETVARPGSLPQVGSFEDLGESEVDNRQSYDGKDQDSSMGAPGGATPVHTGSLCLTPPWTCRRDTGFESCCPRDGSAQARFVTWATWRGSQTSIWEWSWNHLNTGSKMAHTGDSATLNARLATVPLCHSPSC
ncbi:uncharacterized protein LOC115114939 isoform X3 [Oncorhynchus nerka]|uniref:uncharacterized protein LOC115114939 isoform X3 n=1 Tax=Oncorhynchus nerka TaxID=8023 RepID=UPI00112FF95F|nr:uncharacterized protein LOC115114939 isoform X3 [Oncorhynchus nerka]